MLCSLRCVVLAVCWVRRVASSKEPLVPAEVILPQSTLGRHHQGWARPRSGQMGTVTDIHIAECRLHTELTRTLRHEAIMLIK